MCFVQLSHQAKNHRTPPSKGNPFSTPKSEKVAMDWRENASLNRPICIVGTLFPAHGEHINQSYRSTHLLPAARDLASSTVCANRMRKQPTSLNSCHYSSQEFGIQLLVFAIAAGLYDGFHFLAWGAPLASWLSRLLWRVSGVFIASFVPFLLAYSVKFTPLFIKRLPKLISIRAKCAKKKKLYTASYCSYY